jgi:hypothetical protein
MRGATHDLLAAQRCFRGFTVGHPPRRKDPSIDVPREAGCERKQRADDQVPAGRKALEG